jgi:hypothetical protein
MQQPTPTTGAAPRLRRAVTADHAALAALWKRSVVATHHFLTPQAVDELYTAILREYLLPAQKRSAQMYPTRIRSALWVLWAATGRR